MTATVTDRPRLLDLFCGAGGAARGYQLAGFHVTGVDIEPQPNYCGDEFHQADALTFPLDGFDAIHASPPCQGYSRLRHLPWLRGREYPMLIGEVRARLKVTGLPFVIENVADAPLDPSIVLCGLMFGLPLYRHRRFEVNPWMLAPGHPRHEHVISPGRLLNSRYSAHAAGVTGVLNHTKGGGIDQAREAMGIDWMRKVELQQAIPPAYTRWIGEQLMAHIAAPAVPQEPRT